MNIKANRAHKLVFSAAGQDTVSAPDTWTQGQYYQKFNTKSPVTFEDFNGKFALLAPMSYPGAIYHVMQIGLVARITIPQIFGEGFGEWKLMGFCKLVYGSGARSKPNIFAPFSNKYDPNRFNQGYVMSDFY